MVYYCVLFDFFRDVSNVFSFFYLYINIYLIWIKFEEILFMFMFDYLILFYKSSRYFR